MNHQSIKIIYLFLFFLSIMSPSHLMAQNNKETDVVSPSKKVIYKFKEHEDFDLDSLDVEANVPPPGDLSIDQRYRKEFKNQLPERREFNRALENSIETIK